MAIADNRTPLSQRELEVLILVAQGMKNQAIAAKLNIVQRTVEQHITSIFSKLDVQDRTSAVVWAIRVGVIRLE